LPCLRKSRAGPILQSGQVYSLRTLAHAVGLDVEGDLLTVGQRAQAGALDGRDVNENVLLAVVGRDEAEALGGVEKFYGASRGHWDSPRCCKKRLRNARRFAVAKCWFTGKGSF